MYPGFERARMLGQTGGAGSGDGRCVISAGALSDRELRTTLTSGGCHEVVVLERESAPGKGSTGKKHGGEYAPSFPHRFNIRGHCTRFFYVTFAERLGNPCDLVRQGSLFWRLSQKQHGIPARNYEQTVGMGLKSVRLVDPAMKSAACAATAQR